MENNKWLCFFVRWTQMLHEKNNFTITVLFSRHSTLPLGVETLSTVWPLIFQSATQQCVLCAQEPTASNDKNKNTECLYANSCVNFYSVCSLQHCVSTFLLSVRGSVTTTPLAVYCFTGLLSFIKKTTRMSLEFYFKFNLNIICINLWRKSML